MGLDLTAQEIEEIWVEAEQQCPPVTSIERLETIYSVPTLLGSGYRRQIDLYPGLELCIFNETYCDLIAQVTENEHLVQFNFKVAVSHIYLFQPELYGISACSDASANCCLSSDQQLELLSIGKGRNIS